MAKIRLTNKLTQTGLQLDKLFKKFAKVASKTAIKNALGEALITEVRDHVARGVSPVKGFGKFPAYSKAYAAKKGSKRVNLELTEAMLNDIEFKRRRTGIAFGIFGGLSEKKAETHNAGTQQNNGPPARPFIPIKRNTFKRTVMRAAEQAVEEEFEDELEDLARRA